MPKTGYKFIHVCSIRKTLPNGGKRRIDPGKHDKTSDYKFGQVKPIEVAEITPHNYLLVDGYESLRAAVLSGRRMVIARVLFTFAEGPHVMKQAQRGTSEVKCIHQKHKDRSWV